MEAKDKPGAFKKSTESLTAQPITPYLYHSDVDAALEWLSRAFDFKLMNKFAGPDGKTVHAAMQLAGEGIFVLGCPGPTISQTVLRPRRPIPCRV